MQGAFNSQEASSILVRPTQPWEVGVKVTQHTLNVKEAGSIPVPPTSSSSSCSRIQGSSKGRTRVSEARYRGSIPRP